MRQIFNRSVLLTTAAVLALCLSSLVVEVEAAFKPGWEPHACLDKRFKPINISVEVDHDPPGIWYRYWSGASGASNRGEGAPFPSHPTQRFYVMNETSGQMEKFIVKGVGYSPIPPSKYTEEEPFDRFTAEFAFLWRRDLKRIKAMGANVIRVWSWDSFRDHSEFLDACYENGLMIMVPFMFDHKDYRIIDEPHPMEEILTNFRAFVQSVMNHPAVFAYLIGNELNTYYGAQREALFTLVNSMVDIRDEVDFARHPITVPLADVAFTEVYSNHFYPWSRIEFWSVQSYRPDDYIGLAVEHYYNSWLVNMSTRALEYIKPLVLTEFGVDALPPVDWKYGTIPPSNNWTQPPENQTKQSRMFCTMFSRLRSPMSININDGGKARMWNTDLGVDYQPISYGQVVGGVVAMEWNDEWWKGTYSDIKSPMCPNSRTEKHTWCSHNIGVPQSPYYLHEEWLGLTAQVYDDSRTKMCLCPRAAYYSLQKAYQCQGSDVDDCMGSYTPFDSQNLNHERNLDGFGCFAEEFDKEYTCEDEQWCAYREGIFYNPYISLGIPPLLVFIFVVIFWCCMRRKVAKDQAEIAASGVKTASGSQVSIGGEIDYMADSEYRQEESAQSTLGRQLRQKIAEVFLLYCNVGSTDRLQLDYTFCPYFVTAQERLFGMIWDKYLGFEASGDQFVEIATRIVYEQYMEGYYLWLGEKPVLLSQDDMLRDLALYCIIQTWAGTINHSPEKIFEIFEFSRAFFENCVPNNHGAWRAECIQDFHHGMVEIFRIYYLKVDHAEFSYEDVNTDALLFRRQKESKREALREFWAKEHQQMQAQPDSVDEAEAKARDPASLKKVTGGDCPELDLLPAPRLDGDRPQQLHPFLEYHKQRNPEETLLSDCAHKFIEVHKLVTGVKWMEQKEAFAQKGGPFTLLFNYSWIVRYLIWQDIFAKFLQPVSIAAPVCITKAVEILSLVDSIWVFLTFLMHWRVLGRLTSRLVFEGIVSVVLMAAVLTLFILNNVPSGNADGTLKHTIDLDDVGSVLGIPFSPYMGYLAATVIITGFDELRLLVKPPLTTDIPGRFADRSAIVKVRIVYYIALTLTAGGALFMLIPLFDGSGGKQQKSILDILNDSVIIRQWPSFAVSVWVVLFVVVSCGIPYGLARLLASLLGSGKKKKVTQRQAKEEATYLVLTYLFWAVFGYVNWQLAYGLLVPSINNISFDICKCDPANPRLDENERVLCKETFTVTCYLAVAFTWLSAFLVSFVALYAVFEIELLVIGIGRGKVNRVGNVKDWNDVEKYWEVIMRRSSRAMSSALRVDEKAMKHWNLFMQGLFDDCLLNEKEKDELSVGNKKAKPNFRVKPRSWEAIRRITYHLWSLQSAIAHSEVGGENIHSRARRYHRVRTMPTWTCVVPAYNEPIVLEESNLIKTRTPGKVSLRITEIEYLAHTFPDEWDNLAERLKKEDSSWVVNKDNFAQDLVNSFSNVAGHPKLSPKLRFEIRWWATMRGQTLGRTIAGLVNWRNAMLELLKMEEEGIPELEAARIIHRKCQIVISHQTYNPGKDITKAVECPSEEAMEIVFRKLKYFDLVYNDDKTFQSVCKRISFDYLMSPEGQEGIKYSHTITLDDGKTERAMYNFIPKEAFEIRSVQRVGRLKIGEGKAENQMHALQFVNGMVMQAMDMNQYASFENGFKVPYILSDFFNTPHDMCSAETWDHEALIPQYRILGFPEWAFTRSLSLVGELMGAAEWCFVTITHRVLDWPLRLRLHYGHPDFFDAFWVRNRGGQSKASPIVNTNEDIFAGYEMLARGDRGSFIEFLEAQKGRETSFPGAFTFEGKLAQGGAQQIRSYDVYRLNRGLDFISRFGLFFTTLAFYITNLLMAVSVNYYMLSIALFAVGGITYHKLGLLDAVIAVPWLLQIGYVLALPLIVELTLHRGFVKAFGNFISTLPAAILFFIFHLRTKTYYFTQGLLIGKGGYAGTGRGFGLDRQTFVELYKSYSESHWHEALLIFAVLCIYAVYGSDPPGAFFLRTATILLIIISWMWSPIFFNPAATTQDLANDFKEMSAWIMAPRRAAIELEDAKTRLKKIHLHRVMGLVTNLMRDCKEHLRRQNLDPEKETKVQPTASHFQNETLSTFAVANELKQTRSEDGDMDRALATVHDILARSKEKLQVQFSRLPKPEERPKDNEIYDQVVNAYWAGQEKDSWLGWWLKGVIMMQWEAEDQFFPGLINLMSQKIYLTVEIFLPWVVLSLTHWKLDSLFFLWLVVCALGLLKLVDVLFKEQHEYSTVAKGTVLFTVPLPVFYYHYSLMTFGQLAWSMILYLFLTVITIRTVYGTINAYSKFRCFGMSGNPHRVSFEADTSQTGKADDCLQVSIWNRTEEMEVTNTVEETRFRLFMMRMRYIQIIGFVRVIVPIVSTGILLVGNGIIVILSDWITTVNFNGRVNEAWKKAYLRPAQSSTESGGGGGGTTSSTAAPLDRSKQQSQDESQAAHAAVYGSLAASLEPALKTRGHQYRSKNTLAAPSSRFMAMPKPGDSGSIAATSKVSGLGGGANFSARSIPEESALHQDSLSERLLRDRGESVGNSSRGEGGAGGGAPRQQMHFLANIADKYRRDK